MTDEAGRPTLSLVVPVYCEEAVIGEFYRRTVAALTPAATGFDLELVFVDDGSSDRSLEILLALRERDPRVKILHFSRNFGHQIAVTAGVDHARDGVVVIIDADLQDPPEAVLRMIEKWREGYKVVYGVRAKRRGESLFKRFTAKLFYRIIGCLSDVRLPHDSGDFRLLDPAVVTALRSMREESRYVRGMVSWLGFRQYGLEYERDARYAGKTKYPLRKMIRFALNGIASFSEKPLIFAGYGGAVITLAGFAYLVHVVVGKILHPETTVSGWASLSAIIVFFGGIQLLSLGIIGQYVGRIYREVKGRPLYVIEDMWGNAAHPAVPSSRSNRDQRRNHEEPRTV